MLSDANFTSAVLARLMQGLQGSTTRTNCLKLALEDAASGATALQQCALLLVMMQEQRMTIPTMCGLKCLLSSGKDGCTWILVKMSLTSHFSTRKDGARNLPM